MQPDFVPGATVGSSLIYSPSEEYGFHSFRMLKSNRHEYYVRHEPRKDFDPK